MRKLLTILTFALAFICTASHAQTESGKVTGTVIDGSQKIIESATITLLKSSDSSVTKIGVADKNGRFEFDGVASGTYLVSISAIGHEKAYSEAFQITKDKPAVSLKKIELITQAKSLTGVTITSKKPLIEQKIDRTVVNVEASVTNVGNSALEVLEKSPGVTVDKDGNISLKGKQGVQIYIDGRPAYLSGQDLANMLKSMSASQLEQIEIMTNPPAKYDAAGNSGVINIKTKKNKQFGYNGSISTGYTQAKYARFNDGVNFNYRNGKVNVFTSLNYNHDRRAQQLNIERNFRDINTKQLVSSFSQESMMNNKSDFYSAKAGLDYSVSKKTTLGVVLNGFHSPRKWDGKTYTDIYDPSGNLESKTFALSNSNSAWNNYSANLNLRHTIDSAGQEITSDFDYIRYNSKDDGSLVSSYFDMNGIPTQVPDTLLNSLPQHISIYSAKIDYTLPLKKGAKFEAGLKSSYVKTDNDAAYDSLQNGQMVHDYNRSNHFMYTENINAVYVNYSRPLSKKVSGQLGLRLENTNANGNQVTTGQKFKRDYTQLFPTAYLQYSMNDKNQFVLNYGRRIERPDYSDLNPFIHFLDRYTYEQGNPDLKPQFAHNIELSHTYAGFLTSTINYTSTTNIIQQVLEQNEATNETYIKQSNIASLRQYGLSISANKQIAKWWSGNIYANVYDNHFKGVVNNAAISISVATLVVQAQQQFSFGKGWAAELSGFYRTKGVEGVIFIKPLGMVSTGLSKQVLKNKGSIRFNVRDVFKTQNFRGYSKYSNVDAQFENINDSRAFGLSFTWRFNKGKLNAGNNRRNGSASDEQNRVKVGGN